MFDFDIAKKSGLKQAGELEKIFGVSRVMVNSYLTGKVKTPRGRNKIRATLALRVLAGLIEKGALPFPSSIDPEVRAARVEKIRSHVLDHVSAS